MRSRTSGPLGAFRQNSDEQHAFKASASGTALVWEGLSSCVGLQNTAFGMRSDEVCKHVCCMLSAALLCCAAKQGIEQSNLLQRLGPARLFNPAHASCHWVLDLSHPAHEDVARKLVRHGVWSVRALMHHTHSPLLVQMH
jgi:hypothetical protein